MPAISSSLSTTNSAIPLVNAAHLGKAAGLAMHFATVTALNAAVTAERANITAVSPMWSVGQPSTVATEPAGVHRTWYVGASAALSHARTVHLRSGLSVILPNDINTVLATTGAPSNGTGADGDVAVDFTNNNYYLKASGAWGSAALIYAAGGAMSGSAIVTAIDTQLGSAAWQGGGVGTIDGTVVDGSANAVSGNAVFDALALKANKSSDTLTSATLAGITTVGGAVVTTTTNMGAGTAIDITKLKQSKATSAAVTLSFSGTPAAGTTFGLEITNSDTSNARTVTIPSSYSMARQALVTSFELPANGIAYIEWYFDGAVYRMQGDPVALSNKAIVGDFPTGANDTVVLVPYAPHGGTVTAVVTDCVSGTATYQVFINGVALGAASSAVSTTQTTQTTTTARTFVAGDRITVVRTANATCVGGRITIVYAPTAP